MIVIVKTLGSRVGSPTAEGEVRGGAKSKSRAFTSAKTKRKYKKLGHVLLVPPPMPFLPPQLCTLKRASFFLFAICNSTMSCFEFSSLLLCSCLIFFFLAPPLTQMRLLCSCLLMSPADPLLWRLFADALCGLPCDSSSSSHSCSETLHITYLHMCREYICMCVWVCVCVSQWCVCVCAI